MTLTKTLFHRDTNAKQTFIFKRLTGRDYYGDIKRLNDAVEDENIDISIFYPPTDKDILESLFYDTVYGVFIKDKLVAFSILIFREDKERSLICFISNSDIRNECATFENVEVERNWRGFNLEKELFKIAQEETVKMNRKYILGTVSKKNFKSFNSLMDCNFKVIKNDMPVFGSFRELVI